jgi:SAM-dependent methyltransferase
MRRWPPAGTIFDVGGGNGVVAAAMQSAGLDVVLVEPGRNGARNARSRGVESVVCARLEDAGFPPATLPAVGLFDVLEHIGEDRAFLRSIEALLIPGGRLYLTVPAYRVLWSSEDVQFGHYRRYRLGGLRRLLEQSGFRVEYASYLFWALPAPIFLLRTLPSLLGATPGAGPDQVRRDHVTGSTRGKLLGSLLRPELTRIGAGRRIPMGSSCLVVAARAS